VPVCLALDASDGDCINRSHFGFKHWVLNSDIAVEPVAHTAPPVRTGSPYRARVRFYFVRCLTFCCFASMAPMKKAMKPSQRLLMQMHADSFNAPEDQADEFSSSSGAEEEEEEEEEGEDEEVTSCPLWGGKGGRGGKETYGSHPYDGKGAPAGKDSFGGKSGLEDGKGGCGSGKDAYGGKDARGGKDGFAGKALIAAKKRRSRSSRARSRVRSRLR